MLATIWQLLIEEFNKKNTVKLDHLYVEVLKLRGLDLSSTQKKHRVRSCLDQLRKTNKIERVAPSTYRRIGNLKLVRKRFARSKSYFLK